MDSTEKLFQAIGILDGLLKCSVEIASLLSECLNLSVHVSDWHASHTGKVHTPPLLLLYLNLLPWRVAQNTVESRAITQEDLWECRREVNRQKTGNFGLGPQGWRSVQR